MREVKLGLRSPTPPDKTFNELADYWLVSRKQIYKQIDAGTLHAIRLGPRLLRIQTREALKFEREAKMGRSSSNAHSTPVPHRDRLRRHS